MIYSSIVEKAIRQSFEDVNNHRWDDAVKGLSLDARHRVSGDHALGGARQGKQAMRHWFERLGRVFPTLHIEVDRIWVTGWPWNTTVFARWSANEKLLDGRGSYVNNGIHVFSLRWGKVHSIEEYFDSQAAERALAIQAESGVDEAATGPLVS